MTVETKTPPHVSRSSETERRPSAARFVLVAQALVILAFAVGLCVEAGLPPVLAASAVAALVLGGMAVSKVWGHAGAPAGSRPAKGRAPSKAKAFDPARATPPPLQQVSTGANAASEPGSAPDAVSDALEQWADDFDYALLDTSRAPPARPKAPEIPLEAAIAALPAIAPSPNVSVPPPLPNHVEPAPVRLPPAAPLQSRERPDLSAGAAPVRAPAAGPLPDYWSFRPSQSRYEPRAATPPPPSAITPAVGLEHAVAAEQGLRETDVEAIQSLIKKLADEVNLADQQRNELPTASPAVPQSHEPLAANPPPVPAFEPERMVANSVDALRVTAETMRQPSHMVFGHELPPPVPAPPSRASLVAAAISAGRADVLLEPILGLETQEAQHFEVSLRLRADDGAVLPFDRHDTTLRGTGLLPLFDAAKISRTSTVAQRLAERGKTGAVFSSYSGESLTDRAFRDDADAASRQHGRGAGHLVMTFTQSDARSFEAPEWSAIGQMRAVGFRFALSEVTDLDMDIEGLVAAGFDFVKLDAEVFLSGLPAPGGAIPSADVCRYLAGLGLALVVEHIDDEEKFAKVHGFGALLGQGQLFGGARVLKAEPAKKSGQAAA